MVLAAGLGSRMKPLTGRRAKAALPVLDEPLVARMVRQLAAQGVESVVVNAHAHADQVRDALAKSPIPVEISLEPELRGTGGGLRAARDRLAGAGPFLLVNADMVADLDVAALLDAHAARGAVATLALRNDSRSDEFGSIGYASNGLVCRVTDRVRRGVESGSGLFTGVHAIEPELFEALPERAAFDIVRDVYVPLVGRGARIGAWLQPRESAWWPVGTPRELLDANLRELERATGGDPVAADADVEGELLGPVFIGSGARVPPSARVGPRAVVGRGARVPEGAHVTEALLLPDARPSERRLERAIGFDAEVWADA